MLKSGGFNDLVEEVVSVALSWHSVCNIVPEEPLWPLEDFCENTDSVSIVFGDPGNRTSLLGKHAECSEHTIDDARSAGAATVFLTGYDTSAIDAGHAAAAGSGSSAVRSTAVAIRF